MFTCGPMLLCPGGPAATCDCSPEFSSRFWVPTPFLTQEQQPVFFEADLNKIELAGLNMVTSGNSHMSGRHYFEIFTSLIYVNASQIRDPLDPGSDDVTADRLWLYGGVVSCVDASTGPEPAHVFASNASESGIGTATAGVESTFPDATEITGLTPLDIGDLRLGVEVDIDTGAWVFRTMDGNVWASGSSPAIVGKPMLAAVASITGTNFFYTVGALFLEEADFEIAGGLPSGCTAWGIA